MLVVQSGSTLSAHAGAEEPLWSDVYAGVTEVVHAGPIGTDRRPRILFISGTRTLVLSDLLDGRRLWSWSAPPETFLSAAGIVLLEHQGRHSCFCFPTYATEGVCFDLSTSERPVVRWAHEYGSRWDRGFGPNVVALPSRNGGKLLVASRVGDTYEVDPLRGRVTTAEIVLGRSNGRIYQAVLDAGTGELDAELAWRPDPDGYPYSRPYGLLATSEIGGASVIVLASCQVEEFIAVTQFRDGALHPVWAEFVERDWPLDEKELRPQTSSLRDVDGDGKAELVIGVWDGRRWATQILDPMAGIRQPKAVLEGHYFWGVVTAGEEEILVTSTEADRAPGCRAGLTLTNLARGSTDVVAGVRPTTTSREALDASTAFMADRQSLVTFTQGATTGLVGTMVGDRERLAWLCTASAVVTSFDERPATRAFSAGGLVLADDLGHVWRRGTRQLARLSGASPVVVSWAPSAALPEVVLDDPGGVVRAFDLSGKAAWTVPGRMPVIASSGRRIVVASRRPDGADDIVVYERTPEGIGELRRQALNGPTTVAHVAFGEPLVVAATVRTGSHTSRLVVLRADGSRWEVDGGAHVAPPAVWPRETGPWLVVDDHGVLRAYDEEGSVVLEHVWTAAYSTPIPVPELDAVLRANSIHGCALVRSDGSLAWRDDVGLWRHFPARTALLGDPGQTWGFVTLGADGILAVRDVRSGQVLARERVAISVPSALASADINGDGASEIIVGDDSGQLRCLSLAGGSFREHWALEFSAPVCHCAVADLDGDGLLDVVVSTVDGAIHLCT